MWQITQMPQALANRQSSSTLLRTLISLFDPKNIPNPYPKYEQIHQASAHGVLHLEKRNTYLLTGHTINNLVLRSPATVRRQFIRETWSDYPNAQRFLQHMMLFNDGSVHMRLRKMVQKAFTPKVVEEQREMVSHLAQHLLAKMKKQNHADLVSGLSVPLPNQVMLHMLGLNKIDGQKFLCWMNNLADYLGQMVNDPKNNASPVHERLEADAKDIQEYFGHLADELRASPQPGLLSALAAVTHEQGQLNNTELLSNAFLILAAGQETASSLIPGALLEMTHQPIAWEALQKHPHHPNVADELIRVVSPVQFDTRMLLTDLEFRDMTLKANSFVQLALGAANRDPEIFDDPNRIHWQRPNSKHHLGFAAGAHYCLGASLARMEIAETMAVLAKQYPNLQILDQNPPFKPNLVFRGISKLDIALN